MPMKRNKHVEWSDFDSLSERVLTAVILHVEGEVVNTIQQKRLIKTGRLMGSIASELKNKWYGIVYTGVEYALYVELKPGKSYMRYTLDREKTEIEAIIASETENYFKRG